jgi:hypothetical protein
MQRGKSSPENCQISPGGYNFWRQLVVQSLGGEEEGECGEHRHQTISARTSGKLGVAGDGTVNIELLEYVFFSATCWSDIMKKA